MSHPDQIEVACRLASHAHEGQLDKIGAAYIEHPAMVAAFVQALPEFALLDRETQLDAIAAAWLHDVLEDTAETAESLREAGISERAVAAVVALTRTEGIAPDDYYRAIKAQPVALLVKTADLGSNLAPERVGQLDEHTRVRLAHKYRHALEVLEIDPTVITALRAGRGVR